MSYWSDRQDQLRKAAEKEEAAIKKRLSKFYDAELKKLARAISSYYQQYGIDNVIEYRTLLQSLDEADRTLLMEQMDEFAEKYPQYAHLLPVRESIYRLDRLQGLQYSVFMAQANIAGYTNEQLMEYETKLAQQGLNYSMETLGFGKNFYSINDNIVQEFVDVPWCNGENFSTRIWNDTQRVANYINQDMAQAFARGDSYDRIVKDVRRRFGVNRSNAYRLVFTEGTYVMAESSIKPFEEDFTQYEYSPILDGKTCEICRALNGKIFEISERQPGVNFPPMHPWCRCTWLPYVEDWDKWMDDYEQRHSDSNKANKISKRIDDENEEKPIFVAPDAKYVDDITLNDDDEMFELLSNSELSFRGYHSNNPMSEWGHAMFADRGAAAYFPDTLEALADSNRKAFFVEKNQLVDYDNISQKVWDAWQESIEDGSFYDYYFEDGIEELTKEQLDEVFNPPDIVDDAGAFDNEAFTAWFKDKVIEPNGLVGINTSDGAIVFDEKKIHQIIPKPKKAEVQKPKVTVEKSENMIEFENFKKLLNEKYNDIWSEMTDKEMYEYEKLEAKAYKK